MAATILFCYSSFTFWQYLHFSTGGSHAAKHGSVEEKRMEFVELILSDNCWCKGNTIKMIPSLPLCWVKLLWIGSSVPNLTWCSCFPASPTTFSPLTEGQSNFSWWALSVCIVFVSSSAMGVQACAWFSLVFVRLLPDCAQLNNAFYLWQSLSFILSRATFPKFEKHNISTRRFIILSKNACLVFTPENVVFCFSLIIRNIQSSNNVNFKMYRT